MDFRKRVANTKSEKSFNREWKVEKDLPFDEWRFGTTVIANTYLYLNVHGANSKVEDGLGTTASEDQHQQKACVAKPGPIWDQTAWRRNWVCDWQCQCDEDSWKTNVCGTSNVP